MTELIKTVRRETPNGVPYVNKVHERPGFTASAVVGDPESFSIQVDPLMTFCADEVREISIALRLLAQWMAIEK